MDLDHVRSAECSLAKPFMTGAMRRYPRLGGIGRGAATNPLAKHLQDRRFVGGVTYPSQYPGHFGNCKAARALDRLCHLHEDHTGNASFHLASKVPQNAWHGAEMILLFGQPFLERSA